MFGPLQLRAITQLAEARAPYGWLLLSSSQNPRSMYGHAPNPSSPIGGRARLSARSGLGGAKRLSYCVLFNVTHAIAIVVHCKVNRSQMLAEAFPTVLSSQPLQMTASIRVMSKPLETLAIARSCRKSSRELHGSCTNLPNGVSLRRCLFSYNIRLPLGNAPILRSCHVFTEIGSEMSRFVCRSNAFLCCAARYLPCCSSTS